MLSSFRSNGDSVLLSNTYSLRLSKITIYLVILAAALSMGGLVFVQLRLFQEDLEIYRNQFNLVIPEVLGALQEEIRGNEEWVQMVNNYTEIDSFSIESFERAPDNPIFRELKSTVDGFFDRYNLDFEYRIKGMIAGHSTCFFYADEDLRRRMPIINEVVKGQHFMCLCGPNAGETHGHHGSGDYTAFDVSMSYPNYVEKNATLLRTTILLFVVLVGAFSYTVITLNRQKKLSELKNDFINNLTHEFKTPIFSISLASRLLKKSEEVKRSDKLVKYAELIDNEGKRLKSQVDKILQMALIDSGNFKLEKRELDLHDLVRKVSKNFDLIISEQKGALQLELQAQKPKLKADETHLNNIIYNLLDNAVKYTEAAPQIVVSTLNSEKGLELKIKDNGVGISEDVQKLIFDKFYRAESGDLHNVKGFGLGLSYVKSVVEAHGGTIKIRSKRKKGSEFNIFLPFG